MLKRCARLVVAIALALAWNSLASADSGLRSASASVVLQAGQVLPAGGSRMEASSGAVVLTRGSLGEVASGRSETAAGVVLTAGTLKVPEPEPSLLGLAAGLGLLFLTRNRRTVPEVSRSRS